MAPSLTRVKRAAANRAVETQIEELRAELLRTSPYVDFEFVDVTFGTANTDKDIRHSLQTIYPESVCYQLVKADRSTTIYNDQTGTRRAWGAGYIVLRSSAASAVVKLLLFVPRT